VEKKCESSCRVYWKAYSKKFRRAYNDFGEKVELFMEGIPCTIVILVCNLFSLFNNEIKFLLTNSDAEDAFTLINEILFVLLGLEYLLMVMFHKNFLGSFFFYLDFLAFVSMIPDTKFIIDALLPQEDDNISKMETIDHLVKASSASQAGAK
jgi:hypothetical protein